MEIVTVLFILFIVSAIGFGTWVSYEESLFLAAITWVASLAILYWYFGITILSAVGILGAGAVILAYVFLGGLFTAFVLWPRWLNRKKDEIKQAHTLWSKSKVEPDFYKSQYYYPFSAAGNKEKLATWTMLWVFTLIWDATHKPLIWTYEKAYRSFAKLFDQSGKKIVSRILEK